MPGFWQKPGILSRIQRGVPPIKIFLTSNPLTSTRFSFIVLRMNPSCFSASLKAKKPPHHPLGLRVTGG
jgi:hypothetical protein